MPPISFSPSGPISICPGTPITLSAEDGFTNYVWSSSEQGSTLTTTISGSYSVSALAANGCQSSSQPVEITVFDEPATISVSPVGPVTICQGQTATLTATGNYTDLLWSNNDTTFSTTVSSVGTYILTALNSDGCNASSNAIQVSLSAPFNISITPDGDINLCDGQAVTLQAQVGFSNYMWSNQQTGPTLTVTQSGGYSVSASNSSGCVGVSGIVNVATFQSPVAAFTYNQISNYVVEFSNTSTNQGTSLWNFGGNNTSTDINPSYNFPFDGSWPVSLIVSNACGVDTITSNVTVIKTSIQSINSAPISIQTSPTGVIIKSTTAKPDNYKISIFDISGKLILTQTIVIAGNSSIFIEKPAVSSGIYFLQLNSSHNQYINKISW